MLCFFATDLHGSVDRYNKLFAAIKREKPGVVFLGGDLLPHFTVRTGVSDDFMGGYVASKLGALRSDLGDTYPGVFVILGNDDARVEEQTLIDLASEGLLTYAHETRSDLAGHPVYGYSYIPPSPFLLKDWEKYDVSRYTPPGSVSPEEGRRSIPVEPRQSRHDTIAEDLERLVGETDLSNAVMLFHAPPHDCALDRAALDGKLIDHVPLDVHVGSIAIRKFIEGRQPYITLHGHIHESTRLTGAWHDRIGRTHMFNAAHDDPKLALVKFDLENPRDAERVLL